MQKIPIAYAKPGMVLAKPVTRKDGTILIGEDTEISESILNRLDRMDVKEIVVQGEPVQLDEDSSGASFGKRLQRVDHLFRRHEADEWMQQVKQFLKDYFQKRTSTSNH